jgi:hypothetical protein
MKSKIQAIKYLFFALCITWGYSSCLQNPFEDRELLNVTYPDTVVNINSLTPQICEVNIKSTDSTYHITNYWTDHLTGRIVYKMKDEPYKDSRLHGVNFEYDQDGDTLLIAHFENGIRVDSTVYFYKNGNPKHKFFYSSAKDGNIQFEIQFHENGQRETDMVVREDGLLNGAVDYYDDTQKNERTESFYYREGELIDIKIYNKDYIELDRRTAVLVARYRKDSMSLANSLGSIEGGRDVPVFYIGSERDALYDVGDPSTWDIMDVDPAFMLKFNNR